jgi:hypothetical protein
LNENIHAVVLEAKLTDVVACVTYRFEGEPQTAPLPAGRKREKKNEAPKEPPS